MLDVIACILLFVAGLSIKNFISGFTAYDKKILSWLLLWHIIIGTGYIFYINTSGGGDAYAYWNIPKNGDWSTVLNIIKGGSPSGYIFLINYFPAKTLQLSFFTGSMIYMILGYAAFVFLYKVIKENIPNYWLLKKVRVLGIPIFPYFLFLPNINFWTAGLGKDTLIFLSIVFFIYALKDFKKRLGYIIVSVLLSLFIRPHILLFLLLAYGLSIVFDARIKMYNKIFLYAVFIGIFLTLMPYVMNFANVESLDTNAIESYASKKASSLSTRENIASAIDISSYPYPLKVITFLFRPLFIDMPTLFGEAISVENFIFLIFFIKVLLRKPLSGFYKGNLTTKTLIFFFIIGSLVFPLVLGNLGIIIREKTPFILMFIIFGYWSLINYYSARTQLILNKNQRRQSFNHKTLIG
jgi:hypothetical protein